MIHVVPKAATCQWGSVVGFLMVCRCLPSSNSGMFHSCCCSVSVLSQYECRLPQHSAVYILVYCEATYNNYAYIGDYLSICGMDDYKKYRRRETWQGSDSCTIIGAVALLTIPLRCCEPFWSTTVEHLSFCLGSLLRKWSWGLISGNSS